jgi:hypothetical protein
MRMFPPLLGGALATLLCGCGPSTVVKTGDVNPSDTNLATIGRLYAQAEQKLGRPPRTADELKPFLPAGGELAPLLVSPNDNQPYVIVWGAKLISTPDQSVILAYERTGANGYRRVLTPAGTQMLTAEAFAKSTFPPGHVPGG